MEISGKVYEVSPIMEITEKFKKRELILEYSENPQFQEFIKMEAVQDKCSLFDGLQKNDEITVSFNLRGRLYTDKNGKQSAFTTLQVWKLTKSATQAGSFANSDSFKNSTLSSPTNDEDEIDLPF